MLIFKKEEKMKYRIPQIMWNAGDTSHVKNLLFPIVPCNTFMWRHYTQRALDINIPRSFHFYFREQNCPIRMRLSAVSVSGAWAVGRSAARSWSRVSLLLAAGMVNCWRKEFFWNIERNLFHLLRGSKRNCSFSLTCLRVWLFIIMIFFKLLYYCWGKASL